MAVSVSPVDPRDVLWELDDTSFRVYFWSSDATGCREFELVGATDVREVLAWADANRRADELPVVDAVVRDPVGLVRLAGTPPHR